MDDVSSLNLALPTAGAGVPDMVHLMPAGTFKGITGDQVYHLRDAARVIAASMTAGKLPFDENHSTQRATASGSPSPARGWITGLEARDDGIWAKVDWNADGTALMTNKSYRNVSPVFSYARDGTVTRIISAALTNDPNLAELTALHTSGDHMEKTAIMTALGLSGAPTDAEILVALQTAATAKTELATAQAEITRLKTTTAPVADVVALQTRLNTLEAEGKRKAAEAFVDGAIKEGKPIAAVREQIIAMHTADPANAEAMVKGLISINARGAGGGNPKPPKSGEEGEVEMTAEDIAVCTKMGQKPEDFMKTKKALARNSEGSAA